MDRTQLRGSLKSAQEELLKLYKQREEMDREIARTRQYVQTLWMMVSKEPHTRENMLFTVIGSNLTEAVRIVLSASTRPLDAPTIRDQVIKYGFELTSSNPSASVHSVLKRLIEQGEVHVVTQLHPDGDEKLFVRAYWWGEYAKLPQGWVLADPNRIDKQVQKGHDNWDQRIVKTRAEVRRALEKQTRETRTKLKGRK